MLAYEFVAPIHSLRHVDQTGLVAIVSFSVLALFISWLLARLDATQQQQRTLVQRIALLQLLTELLSDTADTGDVARVVVELCIDELGADAAAVMVIEGDRLLVLADRGFTPVAIEPWREFRLPGATPAGDCVRSGELLAFTSGELRDRYPQFDPIDDAIVVCVPLIKDGGTLGVLSLRFARRTLPDLRAAPADGDRRPDGAGDRAGTPAAVRAELAPLAGAARGGQRTALANARSRTDPQRAG